MGLVHSVIKHTCIPMESTVIGSIQDGPEPGQAPEKTPPNTPLVLGWKYFLLAGFKGQAEPGPSPSTWQTSISSKSCKQKHIAQQSRNSRTGMQITRDDANRTKARIDT